MKKFFLPVLCLIFASTAPVLTGCGNSKKSAAKEAYEVATGKVRERMKIPKSTRFPEFSADVKDTTDETGFVLKGDSVKVVVITDSTGTSKAAAVIGHYESQNAMGVFLPGMFKVSLRVDDGKWVGMTGTNDDIEIGSE